MKPTPNGIEDLLDEMLDYTTHADPAFNSVATCLFSCHQEHGFNVHIFNHKGIDF
jgi:hypothetical protein